jgi:hypothetical protein
MSRELDPTLEAAARRRLSSLAASIAVSPATAPADLTDRANGGDSADSADGDHGDPLPSPTNRPRRRALVLVGTAAAGVTALAVAALLAGDDEGRQTVTGPPPGAGSCPSEVADDGVIASGPTPSGGTWEVRVGREPPNVASWAVVDGVRVGGSLGDILSRAPVVNDGMLPLNSELTRQGGIVWGQVPVTTDHVEVSTDDGDVVTACPVAVPTDDLVDWFGLALPPGSRPDDVRALDVGGRVLAAGDLGDVILDEVPSGAGTQMTVDPSLVPLPLGGTAVEVPPTREGTGSQLASGTVAGRTWSLLAGQGRWRDDGPGGGTFELALWLDGTDMSGTSIAGTPDQLLGTDSPWQATAIGDALVLWGPVAPEVTTIVVTFDDGTSQDIATVPTPAGTPLRAFAGALPTGSRVTRIEGRQADGRTVVAALTPAGQLSVVDEDVPGDGVRLSVAPVD